MKIARKITAIIVVLCLLQINILVTANTSTVNYQNQLVNISSNSSSINDEENNVLISGSNTEESSKNALLQKESSVNTNMNKNEHGKIVKEAIGKWEQKVRQYETEDGSYIAASYSEPVNYLKDGQWVEIDNTLASRLESTLGEIYQNKSNSFKATFPQNYNSTGFAKIEKDNYTLTWSLDSDRNSGVKGSQAEVTNYNQADGLSDNEKVMDAGKSSSSILYKSVLTDIDLRYTVAPEKIKEDIIYNKPSVIDSFIFSVRTYGLKARTNADKTISFIKPDKPDEVIFNIPAPYMTDSSENQAISYDVSMELMETDSGYKLVITPDSNWINAPERVFPIYLDPTVSSSQVQTNIADTYVHQNDSAGNHTLSTLLVVGNKTSTNEIKCRSFIKTTTPSLPTGVTVIDAKLNLSVNSGTSTVQNLNVYQVNIPWSSSTMTWNTSDTISKTLIQTNAQATSYSNSPSALRYSCNVTSTFQNIYAGYIENYGFMVRYTNEDYPDYNRFYSSDCGITNVMPVTVITYNEITPITRGIPINGYLVQGGEHWYKFTPSENAKFTFFTAGTTDTYGELYQSSTLLQSNDDDGEGLNFSITRNLVSGTEYKVKVRGYSTYTTGSYSVMVVANVLFDSSDTSSLKNDFNNLLGSGKKSPVHIHTTEQCVDIILSYDSYITSLCNTTGFGMPKAFVQALLMRELWCVNSSDTAADLLVLSGLDNDSSTGYGQIFANTAIGALNYVNSIEMPSGIESMDSADSDDLSEMWHDLYSDQSFNIKMVYYEILNCTNKTSQPNRILWQYSESQIKAILARYNGTGTDAALYGEEVYEYYLIFSSYN